MFKPIEFLLQLIGIKKKVEFLPASDEQKNKGKVITFLGNDTGLGVKNTAAYAIQEDNKLLLIDCGQTVMPELQTRNILDNVSSVDVIITHMHGDHVGSLSQLALYCYFKLKKPLNIITACNNIDQCMSITGVERYNQVPGFPAERYTRENNFVEFIKTEHVGDELDCYGFSATINGEHIVYTGDTITIEPFREYLKEGTYFFVDASIHGGVHLKLEDNLETLKELTEQGINVSLMHLDDKEKIKEMIKGTNIQICEVEENF